MPLIQCGDGGLAPAVIVCKHLLDGKSRTWCPVGRSDTEVEHDWLCPKCLERFPDKDLSELEAVCLHCARRLKKRAARRRSR